MYIVLLNYAVSAPQEAGCESKVILSLQTQICLSHSVFQGPLFGGGMAITSYPSNVTGREDIAQE